MPLYNNKEFTEQQMRLIMLGNNNGLNTDVYAKPYYSPEKMSNLIAVLSCETNRYDGKEFSDEQIELIRAGLEDGLDVDVYANPDYSPEKMEAIMLIMISDSSLDLQHLGEFTLNQLQIIIKGIEDNLRVYQYANPEYTPDKMEILYNAIKNNEDISKFSNPDYSADKMKLLMVGNRLNIDVSDYLEIDNDMYHHLTSVVLENGFDTKYLNINKYNVSQMSEIVEGLLRGLDIENYSNPGLPSEEMFLRRKYLEENNNNDFGKYKSNVREMFYSNESLKTVHEHLKNEYKDSTKEYKEYISEFYTIYSLKCCEHKDEESFIKDIRKLKRAFDLDKLNPIIPFGDFSEQQLKLIFNEFDTGKDYKKFSNPDWSLNQMKFVINTGRELYKNYSNNQLNQLYEVVNNDNVFKVISNPELTDEHMDILYHDYKDGYQMHHHTSPSVPLLKVKFLSIIQRFGHDYEEFTEYNFNEDQMHVIIQGLKDRVNITNFAKPECEAYKMDIIEKALAFNINVAAVLNESKGDRFSDEKMDILKVMTFNAQPPKPVEIEEPPKPVDLKIEPPKPAKPSKKVKARKVVYAKPSRRAGRR